MSFYTLLSETLKPKLSEKETALLPHSYLMMGNVIFLHLNSILLKKRKLVGKAILKIYPYVKAVYMLKGSHGVYRLPKTELLAGKKQREIVHTELNVLYSFPPELLMFSERNKGEKEIICREIKRKETVLDMFAGIGYWSLPIAKTTPVSKVYSIELNPLSVKYLRKNILLNKIKNIEVFEGDCRHFSKVLEKKADRIIMGYLHNTEQFLPAALNMAKRRCIIHFHKKIHEKDLEKTKKKIEKICQTHGFRAKITDRRIKPYAPHVWHYSFKIALS
ncbi:MAG: methyltransferase [Candidatus Aenigmarchaeota archaeon]|nr:methyltransferase [Candidatus Aenigmarchaeota archaeon]